ncbi:MAG TPA: glycosyltransferase family 4 protein, partial [Candidatus Omnitrophota bacterium]|nr:glycosyltransferase family 4 protein [Candidatus Omnitrophota bacterium]
AKEVEISGIKFIPVKYFRQEMNIFCDILAVVELVSIIKKGRYEIVHTHNSKAGFIGRMAAKIAGIPVIIHTVHGFSFHDRENVFLKQIYILFEKLAARWADKIIFVATPLKEWAIKLGIEQAPQYGFIPDGIEISKFASAEGTERLRNQFGFSRNDLIVGVVAKLWEGKGHMEVLAAANSIIREVPNARFLFVGDGPLRKKIEKEVLEKKLDRFVCLAGFRNDIPEITSILDVALLASSFEGLGRVLLEAMICGKPVVATRVGGIPEIVKDGENGYLIPREDPKSISKAVIALLKDPDLRRRMGETGKKMITERYTADKMVSDIHDLYMGLLKSKGLI